MSNKVNWQGSFDALCGVYCAAHLIARAKINNASKLRGKDKMEFYEDAAMTSFSRLIHSMEEVGLLKAAKIVLGSKYAGFTDRQIEKIFNNLPEKHREGLEAVAFSRPQIKGLRNSDRRLVLKNGACAIIHEHGGQHWIAVEGSHVEGGHSTFDPHFIGNTQRRENIFWTKGIFVGEADNWRG